MKQLRWLNRHVPSGIGLLGVLAFVTVFDARVLNAQSKQQTDLFEDKTQQKSSAPSIMITAPALEGPIDPQQYVVGPSDVLGVNIWTVPPMNFVLTVTPEGSIIVPTVGEIRVTGMKLADAKERVLSDIRKKYMLGNPSVTLLNPRDIIVTITGNVRYPGRYTMNASYRVDRLIQEANKAVKKGPDKSATESLQIEENPNYQPETASKRSILVRHKDGSSQRVDILEFFAVRNESRDPFLREGDEVFVPRVDNIHNVFAVYGAVNSPGRFEFMQGDSVMQAIDLAYGFTKRADLDTIELIRMNPVTGGLTTTELRASALSHGSLEDVPLQPGDRIFVRSKFDIRQDFRVFIDGEVRFPGIYPITKDSTKLSQVIQQAGGLTEFASLQSAELLRVTMNIDEAQLDRMLRQRGNITPEDNAYVTVEGDSRVRRDNINVSFERLFGKKDSTQDVYLQTDDHIVIPSVRKTVFVFGQVITPGNVPFIGGKDAEYYIDKAGGFTDNAQKGDVAIIKWSTRQWYEPGKTNIEEGDFIWVPPVVRKPASYWLAIIGQTTSIVSVALSIVLLVIQLKK